MNYDYLWSIFETANNLGLPLDIAAKSVPAVEDMTEKEAIKWINTHYDPVWRAFMTGNKKLFADIVDVCEKGDDHEADILARAYATGNEKLIADMEAKYGQGK